MNALFFERKYRVRVQNVCAIRLSAGPGQGYREVLPRLSEYVFVIDRNKGWAFVPDKNGAGLHLSHLREHWDELRVQIDVLDVGSKWRQIDDWADVEFTECAS